MSDGDNGGIVIPFPVATPRAWESVSKQLRRIAEADDLNDTERDEFLETLRGWFDLMNVTDSIALDPAAAEAITPYMKRIQRAHSELFARLVAVELDRIRLRRALDKSTERD